MSEILFAAILQDLKALLTEEREKHSSLFSSGDMAKRYAGAPISCPPRPLLKTRPQTTRKLEEPPAKIAPPPKKPTPPSPKEALATPEQKEENTPSPFLSLEIPPPLPSSPLDNPLLEKRIQKLFPKWKLVPQPLSDEKARILASSWKILKPGAEILVLLFSPPPLQRAFLKNVAAAIDKEIATAQLIDVRTIEQEKMWDAVIHAKELKAIYAPPLEAWNAPHLLHYVKKIPSTDKSFLGSCPLYFLKNTEIYLHSSSQKRLLWQEICKNHL